MTRDERACRPPSAPPVDRACREAHEPVLPNLRCERALARLTGRDSLPPRRGEAGPREGEAERGCIRKRNWPEQQNAIDRSAPPRSRRLRSGPGAAVAAAAHGGAVHVLRSHGAGRFRRRGFRARVDVRPHPHIGLSTVTYLFEGEIMHRDSLGSEQAIRPGEVNWMTAGRGITHSERFERARREGGRMHGIQAWVACRARHEETEPGLRIITRRRPAGVRVRRAVGAPDRGRGLRRQSAA